MMTGHTTRTIPAHRLTEHMWVDLGGELDLRIDRITELQDGSIKIECGYGAKLTSHFYDAEELVTVRIFAD